jgi:hypothetical protein
MSVRKSLVGVFALCVLFPSTVLAQPAKRAHSQAADDDIREAVIRYEIASWGEVGDKGEHEAEALSGKVVPKRLNFKVFFISINGKDPSDVFMKRFESFPHRIEKLSRSKIDRKSMNAVVDRTTGEKGIVFKVETIKLQGANAAEVEGEYYCDGLCASRQTIKLRRKQGVWKVTGSTMHWIS